VVAQREGGTAAPLACALVTASGRPARWRDSVPGSMCGFVNCLCQRVTNACKWRADAVWHACISMRGVGPSSGGCARWVRSAPTTRQPAADTLVRSVSCLSDSAFVVSHLQDVSGACRCGRLSSLKAYGEAGPRSIHFTWLISALTLINTVEKSPDTARARIPFCITLYHNVIQSLYK
jgi:hypothetical protein